MKIKHILPILALAMSAASCTDLERFPLDQGSSETWYSTETEFDMGLAELYRPVWWNLGQEAWNDDYFYRKIPGQPIIDGTLNSNTDIKGYLKLEEIYQYKYRCIVRANTLINCYDRGLANGISEAKLTQWVAQARFVRACQYGFLVFHWGDVVYIADNPSIESAYTMSRTPKREVIQHIYEDFDYAASVLPESYSGKQQATRGAALAMKARFALWFGDWEIAAKAAAEVIKLADKGVYRLHPDFGEYFHARNDKESIFYTPSSVELAIYPSSAPFSSGGSYCTRLAGGSASKGPSWALLAAFECTDGKLISDSPLFDSKNPFKNRDPRCAETLVEFGTEHLGVVFDSHPTVTQVMDYNKGKKVKNNDMYPIGNINASYNGLVWRKRVEIDWCTGEKKPQNDQVLIRLADVYLTYAEAKIEMNDIDQSVYDAINKVRARAYKCNIDEVNKYPAVTTTTDPDQKALRRRVRRERRVELAFEQLRYYDCIRWGIAKEAFNMPNCGLFADKTKAKKMETDGHWFWDEAPTFSENDVPNFQKLIDNGFCEVHSRGNFSDRMYLWPIPAKEMLINSNMVQNPGY